MKAVYLNLPLGATVGCGVCAERPPTVCYCSGLPSLGTRSAASPTERTRSLASNEAQSAPAGGICLKPRRIFAVGDKQGCWCKHVGLRIEGNC